MTKHDCCLTYCPMALSSFTDDERRECLPTIAYILDMANHARIEGILALEGYVLNKADDVPFFIRTGVELMVDGIDPSLVKGILETLTASSHKANGSMNAETLRRILMTEGLLNIQAGENPELTALKLLSMLGEDMFQEASEFIKTRKPHPKDIVEAYFAALQDQAGSCPLDERLANMSNQDIQTMLMHVSFETLSKAMHGLSKRSQKLLCDNCGMRTAAHIIKEKQSRIVSADEVQGAIGNILDICNPAG